LRLGSERRLAGASEMMWLGGSEQVWLGASEGRLGGASEAAYPFAVDEGLGRLGREG
jgi:hypothetical protein